MTRYVLGFLIDGDHVLLIRKKRPVWQAGFLNGIGGHVENGEPALAAMIREFKEETGATVTEWDLFGAMYGEDWEVSCFVAYGSHSQCKSTTDEEVDSVELNSIMSPCGAHSPVLENVPWLLWMIESRKTDKTSTYEIRYHR